MILEIQPCRRRSSCCERIRREVFDEMVEGSFPQPFFVPGGKITDFRLTSAVSCGDCDVNLIWVGLWIRFLSFVST